MNYDTQTTCRACGSANLTPLFSLGEQMVSDFVSADKITSGVKCPIELDLCGDCTLVQQRHTAPQGFLYTRHYWYRSGVTATMREALADVAREAERAVSLRPGDVVLDIGSNDGTLLRSYTAPGIIRVGVEPATNLAEEGRQGVDVFINDFWSFSAYMLAAPGVKSEHGRHTIQRAKVITALGMFYDLPDPNPFIADVATVLADDGVFIAQLMCAKSMLAMSDIGNLCHEHLEFYTLASLCQLFARHGMQIFNVEENAVNGGSYRLFARKCARDVRRVMGGPVADALMAERRRGMGGPEAYQRFFARAQVNRDYCMDFVRGQHARGKRVWIYGASTKGNAIAQWYGLDSSLIEAAADRSPEKVGKFMVGTGVPIRSEEDFRAAAPDLAIVLPYAFREEFLAREQAWRGQGGRFVFPLPSFEVV